MKDLQLLADQLSEQFVHAEWFYLAVPERDHINVIVHWMDREVFTAVPDFVKNIPVKLTFYAYIDDKYATDLKSEKETNFNVDGFVNDDMDF